MSKLSNTYLYNHAIRNTLNKGGGKTDNVMASMYKKISAINEWSKYKPVVSKKLFIAEDDEERWKASNGQCGFTIPMAETMEAFRSSLEDGSALWSYTPPQGGETEPLRAGDFRGYNPDAVCPLGDLVTSGYSENGASDIYGEVSFSVDVADDLEDNITYGDIQINDVPLTEFYLGIYAWNSSGGWLYKTNTEPLGSAYDFNVTVKMTTGEWNVIPFFCSVPQDIVDGEEAEGVFLSANLPAKKYTIISTNDKIVLTVSGTWNSDKTSVRNILLSIQNNTSDDVTIESIGISLYGTKGNVDNNVGSPASVYYQGDSSNTITIPANSHVETGTGDFASISLGDTGEYDRYYLSASVMAGDEHYSSTSDIEDEEIES